MHLLIVYSDFIVFHLFKYCGSLNELLSAISLACACLDFECLQLVALVGED